MRFFVVGITTLLLGSSALAQSAQEEAQNVTSQESQQNESQKNWVIKSGLYQLVPLVAERNSTTSGEFVFAYLTNLGTFVAQTDYRYTHTRYDDPGRSGIGDLDLYVMRPLIELPYNTQVSHKAQATLPTSEDSQKASLNAAVSYELIGETKFGNTTLQLRPELVYYSYRFETADKAGFVYNPQVSFFPKLLASYRLTPKWELEARGYLNTYRNYAGNSKTDYTLLGAVNYFASETIEINLQFITRDRVITTNPLLDSDTSFVKLGTLITL